jgi:hypothetical protein
MSRSVVVGALILAGLAGGLVMFAIGGSRRLSHVASLALTWTAPVFCVVCFGVAGAVRTGTVADVAVVVAWSVVGAILLGYYVGRLLGRLPRRGPPKDGDRD